MEGDVFVKVDDVVEGGLTEEGDETATDGYMLAVGFVGRGKVTEEDEGYVDVEGQCGGSSDGVGDAKQGTCLCQVVLLLNEIDRGSYFHRVVHESECIDHDME